MEQIAALAEALDEVVACPCHRSRAQPIPAKTFGRQRPQEIVAAHAERTEPPLGQKGFEYFP
jgi:hypothetical protein